MSLFLGCEGLFMFLIKWPGLLLARILNYVDGLITSPFQYMSTYRLMLKLCLHDQFQIINSILLWKSGYGIYFIMSEADKMYFDLKLEKKITWALVRK